MWITISELNTILVYVICVVAFIQPNAPRLFAALALAGITLLHGVFLTDTTGILYYGSAALFDLGIIIVTSGINPIPKMVITIHKICFVSIIANSVGWLVWFLYYPPLVYDATFAVIYIWTLIIILKRDGSDVGNYSLDSWLSCFRFNYSARSGCLNKNAGEL